MHRSRLRALLAGVGLSPDKLAVPRWHSSAGAPWDSAILPASRAIPSAPTVIRSVGPPTVPSPLPACVARARARRLGGAADEKPARALAEEAPSTRSPVPTGRVPAGRQRDLGAQCRRPGSTRPARPPGRPRRGRGRCEESPPTRTASRTASCAARTRADVDGGQPVGQWLARAAWRARSRPARARTVRPARSRRPRGRTRGAPRVRRRAGARPCPPRASGRSDRRGPSL